MAIETFVTDPKTKNGAEVDAIAGERQALIVAVRDLKTFTQTQAFFVNPTNGSDMNKDAAFGGTPVKVHDGIDSVLWTASAIAGAWTFNSTDQAHAGSNSIDGTATANNSVAQLAKGSPQDLSSYVAVTAWVYLTGWGVSGTKELNFQGWNTGTSTIVGVAVNLGTYIDTTLFNTWQKAAIPLADMGLANQTIDSFRVVIVESGAGSIDFYLDDIQIEQTGMALEYTIEPDKDEWYHVEGIQTSMADNITGAISNGTMPGLSYNKILGVTALANGIIYRLIQDGIVTDSRVIGQLSDLLQFSDTKINNSISDGTNTHITVWLPFAHPVLLKSENEDRMTITIQDDLSVLLLLRMVAKVKIETR